MRTAAAGYRSLRQTLRLEARQSRTGRLICNSLLRAASLLQGGAPRRTRAPEEICLGIGSHIFPLQGTLRTALATPQPARYLMLEAQ